MRGEDDACVYAVCAGDRFGDQGLVAFAVVRDAEIVDFTMSCRVAGRGLETRAWAAMARDLRARGVGRVRARWRRTAKNAPVADLFDRLGFDCVADGPDERRFSRDLTLIECLNANRGGNA